ncbi:AAA family ATPase [Candidatus Woesearchaeota archaeon]|jgi:adenylate kinase|nr:AAA family ATPase [Candidatus Woesearchaeota archaeon]MBT6045087.1 AAA family ATPase [Candidatus Woesearchaeota archaeon]
MVKVIAVTGSAGTGKSTYAKKLAKAKGYLYFDVGNFIKKYKIYDSYDKKFKTYLVDVDVLVKVLSETVKGISKEGWKGIVLDGHLSHYLSSKLVDYVVVVRCDIKTLRKRLERRKYSKKKIEENVEAEIMETCLIEAKELKHKVKIVEGKGLNKLKIR